MNVGIISMQRVANYGSFLQALGLKTTLESMGHRVTFIDYKPHDPVVPFSKKAKLRYSFSTWTPVRWMNDRIKYYILGKKEFRYEYNLLYLKMLGITYRHNYNEEVDIAIIGSDEVFNCLQKGFNIGFSPMLFGQNVHAKKVISYAASFGYTDIEGICEHGLEKALAEYFQSFDALSVRDENSRQIVKRLTGVNPSLNLDPVLVSDYTLPDIEIPYKNYILLYTYKSRHYSEEEINIINEFCVRNNKMLISVGNAQGWVKTRAHANPLEMLCYIKNADFIITDTFHGTVFSIKYNKNFATFIRHDNHQKLDDLLTRLKQKSREVQDFRDLQLFYEHFPDFEETNAIIKREKERTLRYLQENLHI